jgi:predicted dehydrogenase
VTPHIGLVGCGNWGRYILRDLKGLGCRVTVVAVSPQTRQNAEFAADHILDSVEEFGAGVDGFVVATPTSLHAETVTALLRFQRPIFCEKPLTNNLDAARLLVQTGGDRIFVMDKWRYHPGIEALRDIAASGELGPVESIRSFRLGWANPHADVDSTWILLPHDLTIVLEILGHIPEPVSAVPEYANARLTGLTAVLGESPNIVAAVSEKSVENIRSISLNFRDGAATLEDSYAVCIKVRRVRDGVPKSSDAVEQRPISDELPLQRELTAFLNYLKGGPPPKSSASEALRVVEVITELRRRANIEG